jgi:uncharacterized peroxidase-related enzyme
MSWIKTVEETEARGVLKEIYEEVRKRRGKISNIMKVQSLEPEAMKAHLDLYMAIMFGGSPLKREEREMLGVLVSSLNRCEYCIVHHSEALKHYWRDEEKVKRLAEDYRSLNLTEREIRMLEYAEKLTKNPTEMEREDVETLKRSGFSDREILSINLITSYFNFVNRIVLGLGVSHSEDEVRGYIYEKEV